MIRLLAIILVLAGCASNRDQQTEQHRHLKRETTEVRQEVHDGKVVQLVNKTITVEREANQEQQTERTEVEQPQVLGDLAGVVKTGARALAGATMGPAGPAAVDWIWQTIAGVAGLGTAGGVGAVMRERKARRNEDEQRKKVTKAMDDYAADIEEATTPEQAAAVKEKHRRRQIALGIHQDVERARHG
jgi:hypothetical protein